MLFLIQDALSGATTDAHCSGVVDSTSTVADDGWAELVTGGMGGVAAQPKHVTSTRLADTSAAQIRMTPFNRSMAQHAEATDLRTASLGVDHADKVAL